MPLAPELEGLSDILNNIYHQCNLCLYTINRAFAASFLTYQGHTLCLENNLFLDSINNSRFYQFMYLLVTADIGLNMENIVASVGVGVVFDESPVPGKSKKKPCFYVTWFCFVLLRSEKSILFAFSDVSISQSLLLPTTYLIDREFVYSRTHIID